MTKLEGFLSQHRLLKHLILSILFKSVPIYHCYLLRQFIPD